MKRFIKEIFFVSIIVITLLLYTAQLQSGHPILHIHWIILIGTILLYVEKKRTALFLLLTTAIIELYSSLPFGILLFSMIGAFFVVRLSNEKLFKKFALHSIIIHGALFSFVFYTLFIIIVSAAKWSGSITYSDFSFSPVIYSFFWQIITHSILLSLVYFIIRFIQKSFIHTKTYG